MPLTIPNCKHCHKNQCLHRETLKNEFKTDTFKYTYFSHNCTKYKKLIDPGIVVDVDIYTRILMEYEYYSCPEWELLETVQGVLIRRPRRNHHILYKVLLFEPITIQQYKTIEVNGYKQYKFYDVEITAIGKTINALMKENHITDINDFLFFKKFKPICMVCKKQFNSIADIIFEYQIDGEGTAKDALCEDCFNEKYNKHVKRCVYEKREKDIF